MKCSHGITVALLAGLTAAMAVGQNGEPEEEQPREKRWRLQAGWVHQWGRGMDVSGPVPSLYREVFPANRRRWVGQPPPNEMSGPEEGLPSVWNYDDGYVFRDEQSDVANPGDDPNAPYTTHYWHYESPGQYNGANHTLTFNRNLGSAYSGGPRTTDYSGDDDLPEDGIEIKLSRWYDTWERYDIDLEVILGLAWFPDTRTANSSRSTEQDVTHRREMYTYVDYFGTPQGGGWQPGLDHWYPFYGQFRTNDDPPGDNPIIPLDYTATRRSTGGTLRDTVSVEGSVSRLRGAVGPQITKPLSRRWTAYVAPQFALEYLDLDVRRHETVDFTERGKTREIASRADQSDKVELVPAFLLTGGVQYSVTTNWFVGASVGWEWVGEDVKVKVGPDTVRFDLEGGEFSLIVGRKL